MSCPSCGGQLPPVVLEAVGAFLLVPFAVVAAVLVALRRALRPSLPAATADDRPPPERA